MKSVFLFVSSWWIFATPAIADTLEIFLLKTHENSIENLDLASKQGHTITYYYLDAQKEIEDKLSKEVDVSLSRIFETVVNDMTKSELKALGDEGITQRVMELVTNDTEFLQQSAVMKSVSNDPDIKEALIRAEEDKQRAKTLGVLMQDLPAVVFKKRRSNNVSDLGKVLQASHSE